MKAGPVLRRLLPAPLQKKKKSSGAGRRPRCSGRAASAARASGISSTAMLPADVCEAVDTYYGLSAPALLFLAVGVGQQLSAQLGPMRYAMYGANTQAEHVAMIVDVRDVTQAQIEIVAEAVLHLRAIERVLLSRMATAENDVEDHMQSDLADAEHACAFCCELCDTQRR
jgi:hypothetical protein